MVRKNKKKPMTPEQISHQKFLTKMGVSPKQLREKRKAEIRSKENGGHSLTIDTLDSVRRGYDD